MIPTHVTKFVVLIVFEIAMQTFKFNQERVIRRHLWGQLKHHF